MCDNHSNNAEDVRRRRRRLRRPRPEPDPDRRPASSRITTVPQIYTLSQSGGREPD